jgi:hypothetical protein
MVVDIDCISGLERAKDTQFLGFEETMFGSEICELVAYCTQGKIVG